MSYPHHATLVKIHRNNAQEWEYDKDKEGLHLHDRLYLRGEQAAPGGKVGDRARLELRDGKVYAVLVKEDGQ